MGESGIVTLTFDLRPWNSTEFVRLLRHTFLQNFIQMRAAVHELLWSQRKKTRTNTIQSVATARTVKSTREGTHVFLYPDRHQNLMQLSF